MSTVAISYSSLTDASNEAKDVANKLDAYANSLNENVYKKLNNYKGACKNELFTAKNNVSTKISDLQDAADEYRTYAGKLTSLRDECKRVDEAVKTNVSELTATFKEDHGINNNWVVNTISYVFVSVGNSSAFGRWLGRKNDEYEAGKDYFKSSIKEWYNYGGGKELIKGALVGALEVAIGVLAIVGAILSGGALIAIVAGVVGGIIAVLNGFHNIWNEQKAYTANSNNDPATGRRRSKINTWQDYLRSSFIYGDDGVTYGNDARYKFLATSIDVVNLACSAVTLYTSGKKLLQNGYKWATNSASELKKIGWKDIFSKDAFKGLTQKFSDVKLTIKARGWASVKDYGMGMVKDIGRNLKAEFWTFDEPKEAVGSIKNILGVAKSLISNEEGIKGVIKTGLKDVALPALTAFSVDSTDGYLTVGKDGQVFFDFTDKITFSDVYGVFDKVSSAFSDTGDVWNICANDAPYGKNVMEKFSTRSGINISAPNIPDTELKIVRVA